MCDTVTITATEAVGSRIEGLHRLESVWEERKVTYRAAWLDMRYLLQVRSEEQDRLAYSRTSPNIVYGYEADSIWSSEFLIVIIELFQWKNLPLRDETKERSWGAECRHCNHFSRRA